MENNAPHCIAISVRIGATQRASFAFEPRLLRAAAVVSNQLQCALTARVLTLLRSRGIAFLQVIFGSTSGSSALPLHLTLSLPMEPARRLRAGLASFTCSVASKRMAPLIEIGPGAGSNVQKPGVWIHVPVEEVASAEYDRDPVFVSSCTKNHKLSSASPLFTALKRSARSTSLRSAR